MNKLNDIIRRNLGENFIPLKEEKPTSAERFKLDLRSAVLSKNRSISFENAQLKNMINDTIDYSRGVYKPRAEANVPLLMRDLLDVKKLVRNGYVIPGMSEEEAEEIRSMNTAEKVKSWFSLHFAPKNFEPISGQAFLDEEGNLKAEFINEPTKLEDKLETIINKNSKARSTFLKVCGATGLLQNGVLVMGVVDFFTSIIDKMISSKNMDKNTKRYLNMAISVKSAEDLANALEDLSAQAGKLGKNNDVKNFAYMIKKLRNFIEKETKTRDYLAEKLKQKLQAQQPQPQTEDTIEQPTTE